MLNSRPKKEKNSYNGQEPIKDLLWIFVGQNIRNRLSVCQSVSLLLFLIFLLKGCFWWGVPSFRFPVRRSPWWTPGTTDARRRWKIWTYRRPADTHALRMRKFQLRRKCTAGYVMIVTINHVKKTNKMFKKCRWREVEVREPQHSDPSSNAATRAQDVYSNVYMVDCCIFASYLSSGRPLFRAKIGPSSRRIFLEFQSSTTCATNRILNPRLRAMDGMG